NELAARYTTRDLTGYLNTFGFNLPDQGAVPSKRLYAQRVLSRASLQLILQMAEDLDLDVESTSPDVALPPKNWEGTGSFKLFVSHISADKEKALRLRNCLAPFGIAAFVAHEDIHPTREWEDE